MLDDDEYVAQFGEVSDSDEEQPGRMDLTGYDPVVAKLTDVCDLLISNRTTLIAVNSEKGKGPKNVKYMQRP